MAKYENVKVFGPAKNLDKVQKILSGKGGLAREVYPRVKYEDLEDPEEVYFQVTYRMKESNVNKVQKKLKKYCSGFVTLES